MKNIFPFGLGFLAGVLFVNYRLRKMPPPSAPPVASSNGGYTPSAPAVEVPAVLPAFPKLPVPVSSGNNPNDGSWTTTTAPNNAGDYWQDAQINGIPRRGSLKGAMKYGTQIPPDA